ncbi:Type 1 glutamine amidotransferase-like domain-containing protein [Sphingobacterium sp. Mn56C]|uniref:Type 1 glutamine amidotransferase-like domain-containing protein n=1 Tax=Sphingobacterium sp. Mn56C TaxID=3395261 RepID=UPI003BC383BB
MKKLFLASSFCDVALYFEQFCGEQVSGKSVTFIPTASDVEDYTGYVANDRNAFSELGITVDELNISGKTEQQIAETLAKNDFIYVSGGNTFYLLQELIKSKADKLISAYIEKGKTYIGASAGSIILSPNIQYLERVDAKDVATELSSYTGLGLIDFYPLPHFGNEPFADLMQAVYNDYQDTLPLIPISNTQVIQVKGTERHVVGQ